jgi:ornithine carbamoyltransferase
MHFLSIDDITTDQLIDIVNNGVELAINNKPEKVLQDKVIGMFFAGYSTRTRTSFSSAALRLGASIIQFGPNDLQLCTGETAKDSGLVLSQYLDALVVRTNGKDQQMRDLAIQSGMKVINAMSESEHPTQIIADLITIQEEFGRLSNINIVYLGEGNNTAVAMVKAISKIPCMKLTLLTPKGYGVDHDMLKKAKNSASLIGTTIIEIHSIEDLPDDADVVYTTRWETMGVGHPDPDWKLSFHPFKVTQQVMDKANTKGEAIFMHDLPAVRGEDVDSCVLDGLQSRAFRQAFHKMSAAMSVLSFVLQKTELGENRPS